MEGRFVGRGIHRRTANKDVSCLSSYWKYLASAPKVAKANPWQGQQVSAGEAREQGGSTGEKRPFTDDEVVVLLRKIGPRERQFSLIAALSGMRQNEIARLCVHDCVGGVFNVRRSKTAAGVRKVPIHPDLAPLIATLSADKAPADYLFAGLPEPSPNSKRDRGAAVAQAFTRARRAAGVDPRAEGSRQADVDFHSWRRWFVRTAVEALEKGTAGYTVFTIAHVVGHKIEGGALEGQKLPLAMTMGVYAGAASADSLRACVEAVKLPSGVILGDWAERRDRPSRPKPKPARQDNRP